MSSFFSQQTTTVEIDAENSVTIRKLTHGEASDITGQCMVQKMQYIDGKVEQTMDMDALKYRDLHVFTSIVSWQGPGFEDRPVSMENFRALPDSVFTTIAAAVDAQAELSSAEKKESSEPTN